MACWNREGGGEWFEVYLWPNSLIHSSSGGGGGSWTMECIDQSVGVTGQEYLQRLTLGRHENLATSKRVQSVWCPQW